MLINISVLNFYKKEEKMSIIDFKMPKLKFKRMKINMKDIEQ